MPHLSKHLNTKQKGVCFDCNQPKDKHCCTDYYRAKTISYVGYEEWLPNVRVGAPNIEDPILIDYIRRGAIEFAKRTKILKRNICLEIQNCVADYYPCLGEEERISSVKLLSINGKCYEAIGDTCTWDVDGRKFWFHPPHTLEIHPAPKEDSEVILTVVAAPVETSGQVDSIIYDRYFDAIEHYAIAQAMLIPLSKEERARTVSADVFSYRMNEFKKIVNQAKIDIAKHFSSQSQYYGGHACGC